MSNRTLSILVACGSGVATSTIAAKEIEGVCRSINLTNYKITKCSMTELPNIADDYDVILSTNNYKGQLNKPYMNVIGFISGINKAKLKENLSALILKTAEEI